MSAYLMSLDLRFDLICKIIKTCYMVQFDWMGYFNMFNIIDVEVYEKQTALNKYHEKTGNLVWNGTLANKLLIFIDPIATIDIV